MVTKGYSVSEKAKAVLLVKLYKRGVDTTSPRFLKPELIDMCHVYSIPVTVTPVWCGNPKGKLQLFFECRYIDSLLVTRPGIIQYSKDNKKKDEDTDMGEVHSDCKQTSDPPFI